MGNAAIFNGQYVKLLKDQLKLKDTASILTGSDDPTLVAKEAEKGSLYLRQNTSGPGQLYIKLDNGNTTNWSLAKLAESTMVGFYDPVSTTLPTGANPVVDGVAINNGDTVLFGNLGIGNYIAYSASDVGTSVVWTEQFEVLAGDKVYILAGTLFGGQEVVRNGSGELLINDVVRYFDGDKGVNYRESTSLKTADLLANTTTKLFDVNSSASENIQLHYSILRGSSKENGIAFYSNVPGQVPTIATSSGTVGNAGAALNVVYESNGTDDTAFYANLGTGFNNAVSCVAVQADDKILVGGPFTGLDGNTRNRLVRLNSDGTEDTAFYANLGAGFNSQIRCISVQADGKILVGGAFSGLDGNTRNRLVRLNSDGTEDTAFYANLGTGFSGQIYTIFVQTDGKILVGGALSGLDGNTRNRLVRLNSDGTEDTAFYANLGTGFDGAVSCVAVQADGKILVGGAFTGLNSNTRNFLVRLNSNGTEDTAFYANLGTGFNSQISTIFVQTDGKILVGGAFTGLNSNTRNFLVRLNSNGTDDTAFYANLGTGFNGQIFTIFVQTDGKILVGGQFTGLNSNTRNFLVRLNSNGTDDTAFYANLGTGFNNVVSCVAVQADDKILVGGPFTDLNSNTRNRLVRLKPELYIGVQLDNSGPDAIMKYWVDRWGDAPGGPSGLPIFSTAVSNVAAAGSLNEVQFHGPGGMLSASSDFAWDSGNLKLGELEISKLYGPVALLNNQVATTAITYPDAYNFAVIEYSIVRDGAYQVGTLHVVHDGAVVEILDVGKETNPTGITFGASIGSGNVNILYDSTNTGQPGTLKYSVRKWGN